MEENNKGIIYIKSCSRSNGGKRIEFNISFDSNISSDDNTKALWYEVEEKYKDCLCERADCVIVTLLPYALKGGFDFRSELPVSEKLYYNLTYHLIPQFHATNKCAQLIKITAPIAKSEDLHPTAVASGMSCGVDSLTTFFEYTEDCDLNDYKLTHLTFFESGAHHLGGPGKREEMEQLFLDQLNVARSFCDKQGYELISVRSNLNFYLAENLWSDVFDNSHTYRNIGFALLLQKLIRIYYYSSAYNIDYFHFDLNNDTAEYEKYMLQFFSTDVFSAYSSNKAMKRIDKTKYISQFPASYDILTVCFKSDKNCGKCIKCARTLLTLDFLGILDKYKNSFDTDYYRQNRSWYLEHMCYYRHNHETMNEVYQFAKNNNIKIPLKCRFKGNTTYFIKQIYEKFKKLDFIRKLAFKHKPY